MRSLLAALVISALLSPAQLSAQTPVLSPELQPGARLRIDAPGVVEHHFVGTLILPGTDSLLLAGADGPPITIRPAQITSLEVSRGRSRLVSGIIGALVAAPAGYAMGHVYVREFEPRCSGCPMTKRQRQIVQSMTLAGAGMGLVIGTAVGRERWTRVSLTRMP